MNEEKFCAVYDGVSAECRSLFEKKMVDYGPTWLLFRPESLIDQLWIKAKRIRTLEQNGDRSSVGESREGEFIGLINYAVIMRMITENPEVFPSSDDIVADTARYAVDNAAVMQCYDAVVASVRTLMIRKNHDYGAAWLDMDPHAITDQIIIKILRLKNITSNGGKLLVSENIDAQLSDVINYSVFGLLRFRGMNSEA